MTIAERNNKLKHFITCLKCEVSGKCCDDNCSTQYDAGNMDEIIENLEAISKALEPQSFKWCTDCKEYDQEKHCCHRWSKVIRDTVEEMKQEPFINKPCVSTGVCEHDKNKVLDKIRAEIEQIELLARYTRGDIKQMALDIIDKYKAESEGEE